MKNTVRYKRGKYIIANINVKRHYAEFFCLTNALIK